MTTLSLTTHQREEALDITDIINDYLLKSGYEVGLVNLFVKHTTCALACADLDPGTDKDYLKAFREIVPRLNYTHPHNPTHVGDHILSTILGPSLTIPVESNSLALGEWQRVVLFEFNGPRERKLFLTFWKEK